MGAWPGEWCLRRGALVGSAGLVGAGVPVVLASTFGWVELL